MWRCRGGRGRVCPRIDEGPKGSVPTGFAPSSKSIPSDLSQEIGPVRPIRSIRPIRPKTKTRHPALYGKRLVAFAGTDGTDRTDGTDFLFLGLMGGIGWIMMGLMGLG